MTADASRGSGPSRPARILVVDDHAIVRHGLVRLLEAHDDLEVCGEAADADEALRLVDELGPGMAVVDLALEGTDGLELVERITEGSGMIRCLVLSVHDESLYAERALRAGASGYVMKEEATDTLVKAIRTVLDGEVFVSERIMDGILRKLAGRASGLVGSPLETLTDRELQVFRLLGEGNSTREVADQLGLSMKTIETHRAKIMDKLGLENATQLLHRAIEWVQRERGFLPGRDEDESGQ